MGNTSNLETFYAELGEDYDEAREDFLAYYAHSLIDGEQDPVKQAYDCFFDNWEFEVKVSIEEVKPWAEDEKAVKLALIKAKEDVRREKAIQAFRHKREAGSTFLQAVKASGEDAAYMTHVVKKANMFELDEKRLQVLRQARIEEHRSKAYKARQKAYRAISSKVKEAMKKADFSKLSPDKLADIMLKLTQITKEDEPPEMTIKLDWDREI